MLESKLDGIHLKVSFSKLQTYVKANNSQKKYHSF
jgi:hypothetical protein